MVREDLVSSAVSFLQDPSVAASALDKRIAFLQSKNLTKEEIDISLARAGEVSQASNAAIPLSSSPPGQYGYQSQSPIRQPPGYGYGYGPYQGAPWSPTPPEPPQRDWRDWFIMATMTTTVGYGLYAVAKRYVLPLITPPTPPQLSADRASIDASFSRAFALIDQLTTDTADLKEKETQRTEKLDTTLKDVDAVIEDLKAANARRDAESRILADQMIGIKEQIPKALEAWKANGDAKLEELGQEMQSLKKLLENKVGRGGGAVAGGNAASTPSSSGRGHQAPESSNEPPQSKDPSTTTTTNNQSSSTPTPAAKSDPSTKPASSSTPQPSQQRADRKAIPAWQRAAATNNVTSSTSTSNSNSSGESQNSNDSGKVEEAGA